MTLPTHPAERVRLSRRTVLGLGVATGVTGVATACATDRSPGDRETPAARAVHSLEPDVAVAVEAVTIIRGAQAAVAATGQRHAGLAARLAGLTDLHRAHLDALTAAVPDGVDTSATGAAYAVPARPQAALVQLAATERTLHDGLLGLAMRARSGPFARLLGAMTAAVSQQLAGLRP